MAQWNPLHDLVSLQDRMNRLFEDASQRRASEANPHDEVEAADWYPAADVYEQEGEYTVAGCISGVEPAITYFSVEHDTATLKRNSVTHDYQPSRGDIAKG